MKFFWDTSAVINAAVSPQVKARLKEGEHVARLHVLHEFFSTMTGRGLHYHDKQGNAVNVLLTANDAAKWLRGFAEKISLVELDLRETLAALDQAQSRSVQGGKVYDYAHALAADKAGADVLLTRNTGHFENFTRAKVVRP